MNKGNPDSAIIMFEKSLSKFTTSKEPRAKALAKNELSSAFIVKGEYELTANLPYAEKTKTIIVETNRQSVMKTSFKKSKRYILGVTSIGVVALLFHLLAK